MNGSELSLYLQAGFIDFTTETDERFLPKILTNNEQQQIRILENLLFELENCDEFFFSVAFITNSGVACLVDTLKKLQNKNIKGKILASQYQNFTEPRALKRLLAFPNIELKIITSDYNFHAKGYLFHKYATTKENDNYTMIIGSSNLTQSALTINREWNVRLSSMKDGALIRQMQSELHQAWQDATLVNQDWLKSYELIYSEIHKQRNINNNKLLNLYHINPNKMQTAALKNIAQLRNEGKSKALLISATGTGKTYLSAFDVCAAKAKRCLFIVHRGLIAYKSMQSFQKVIDPHIKCGLFTNGKKELKADYIFATVQTLIQVENLHLFSPTDFDYIIIDEAHHAGANSYQKILNYFKPKFLLGMTATPERTDGHNIFKDFDYNIAYEIRLQQALSENMLVPFHYHGISEIEVNGQQIDDNSNFNLLVTEERVKHILYHADFYGCDQGRIKGLVFCRNIEEAKTLCHEFNIHGRRSAFIDGNTPEFERKNIIKRLETDDLENNIVLDYIFSVDVLNEGIDIPAVNQIILLRPTQSAIIFVQQLGRGLRKTNTKRYLEVIDFIGNYDNNYLLPIALYGDRSYNREHLKRIMHNNFLPGASTVYFEDIIKEHIFQKLNTTNLKTLKNLRSSYLLVKFKLGHTPMMMDFVRLGDKDPYLFIEAKKSYYEFKQYIDADNIILSQKDRKILQFISCEIANGKRLEEIALLEYLLTHNKVHIQDLKKYLKNKFSVLTNDVTLNSVVNVLTLKFFKQSEQKKYGKIPLVKLENEFITFSEEIKKSLENNIFSLYFIDTLSYGKYAFLRDYNKENFYHGFKLYNLYTRKDVCRILNWENDESSTIYGYRAKYNTCPIFVTYEKSEDISESTRYNDKFIDRNHFHWWSRLGVQANSKEVLAIKDTSVLKLLFIKKNDSEGSEFYFIGPIVYEQGNFKTAMRKNNTLPILEVYFKILKIVNHKIYNYLTNK